MVEDADWGLRTPPVPRACVAGRRQTERGPRRPRFSRVERRACSVASVTHLTLPCLTCMGSFSYPIVGAVKTGNQRDVTTRPGPPCSRHCGPIFHSKEQVSRHLHEHFATKIHACASRRSLAQLVRANCPGACASFHGCVSHGAVHGQAAGGSADRRCWWCHYL